MMTTQESADFTDQIIPITEWPVSVSETQSSGSDDPVEDSTKDFRKRYAETIPIIEWPVSDVQLGSDVSAKSFKRKYAEKNEISHSFLCSGDDIKKQKLHKNSGEPIAITSFSEKKQPDVATKIARWWREQRALGFIEQSIPKCCPKSMVYHISRLPECRNFLRKEKQRILQQIEKEDGRADLFATLAGLEDFTNQVSSAFFHISQAVRLIPTCADYLWMKEKLHRQCQVLEKQAEAKKQLVERTFGFPSFTEVPRISCDGLSVAEFQEKYIKAGKPVIITDVVDGMTESTFDYTLVSKYAGNTTITSREAVWDSLSWAKLEDKREVTVADLIRDIQTDSAKDVLFDWSLPLHCPRLAEEITMPSFFQNNLLLRTSPGSLYADSWPSLFISPKGAITNLHVDAFHSHFWMALFQGQKRWTFFDQQDVAYLYPQWVHSMDPVFKIDMQQPDLDRFPLLALTRPQRCVLQPGELLFVPAGSPHFVENLTSSLAISSNYVDSTNFHQVCKELEINALQDDRAKDLLQQLQDPDFISRHNL